MVRASQPAASVMRFAALPVGAQSSKLSPSFSSMVITNCNIVVLPVPGPPVITSAPLVSARRTARFCSSARDSLYFVSSFSVWLSILKYGNVFSIGAASRLSLAAHSDSILYKYGRKQASVLFTALYTTLSLIISSSSSLSTGPGSDPNISAAT